MIAKIKLALAAVIGVIIAGLSVALKLEKSKTDNLEKENENLADDIHVKDTVIEVQKDAQKIQDDIKLSSSDDVDDKLRKYQRD